MMKVQAGKIRRRWIDGYYRTTGGCAHEIGVLLSELERVAAERDAYADRLEELGNPPTGREHAVASTVTRRAEPSIGDAVRIRGKCALCTVLWGTSPYKLGPGDVGVLADILEIASGSIFRYRVRDKAGTLSVVCTEVELVGDGDVVNVR